MIGGEGLLGGEGWLFLLSCPWCSLFLHCWEEGRGGEKEREEGKEGECAHTKSEKLAVFFDQVPTKHIYYYSLLGFELGVFFFFFFFFLVMKLLGGCYLIFFLVLLVVGHGGGVGWVSFGSIFAYFGG